MEPAYQLSRRKFLQAALITVAATGSGIACSGGSPWRLLTIDEARALAAACDRIIPTDEFPGAAWAGAVNFIDRQLLGPWVDLQNSYRLGIAAMNKSSRLVYGSDFAFLSDVNQRELLTRMEQGQTARDAWQNIPSSEFFGMMVDHTMQAFYGDPRHGGNRERVAWKLVGLWYPPVRGRLQYDLSKS